MNGMKNEVEEREQQQKKKDWKRPRLEFTVMVKRERKMWSRDINAGDVRGSIHITMSRPASDLVCNCCRRMAFLQ
jgi:hypothetical protein